MIARIATPQYMPQASVLQLSKQPPILFPPQKKPHLSRPKNPTVRDKSSAHSLHFTFLRFTAPAFLHRMAQNFDAHCTMFSADSALAILHTCAPGELEEALRNRPEMIIRLRNVRLAMLYENATCNTKDFSTQRRCHARKMPCEKCTLARLPC